MENRETFSSSINSSKSGLSTISNSTLDVIWEDQERGSEFVEAFKDLTRDSETTFEFVVGANEIICSTLVVNVFLVSLAVVCVIEAGIGIKNLSECPENPNIPVFLLVGGGFGTLKAIHTMYGNFKLKKHNQNNLVSQRADDIVDITLNIFLLIWQGLGAYWTFSVWYPPSEEPLYADPKKWCNQDLYLFAIVQCGIAGILITIVVLIHCGFAFCFKCTNCFR